MLHFIVISLTEWCRDNASNNTVVSLYKNSIQNTFGPQQDWYSSAIFMTRTLAVVVLVTAALTAEVSYWIQSVNFSLLQ